MTRSKPNMKQQALVQAGKSARLRAGNLKGSIGRSQADRSPASGGKKLRIQRFSNRLSWPADDCMTVHVRASNAITGTTAIMQIAFALDPTKITTTGYGSIGAISSLVEALSKSYSRFMVTNATFKVTLTTPVTGGGYVGMGYTPDNSQASGLPASLTDATSAVHSDITQVGNSATITLDPSDYFVDWRPTLNGSSSAEPPDNQCGVVQVYGDSGFTTSSKAVFEVDLLIHFAGFRYIP